MGMCSVLLLVIDWSNFSSVVGFLKWFFQSPIWPLRTNPGLKLTAEFFLKLSTEQWFANFSIWSSLNWKLSCIWLQHYWCYKIEISYTVSCKLCYFFDILRHISYKIFIPYNPEIWIIPVFPSILKLSKVFDTYRLHIF